MSKHHKVKTRLGDLLLEKGLITEEQLHLAIQIQKTNQLQIGEILVANGWVTKRQINKALRVQSKLRNAILTSILSFSPLVLIGGAADAIGAPKTVKESQESPGKGFGKGKQTTDTSTSSTDTTSTDTTSTTDTTSPADTTTDTSATTDTSTASTDTSGTTDTSTTTDTSGTTDTSTTPDSSTDVVTADPGATIHLSWDYPLERVDGTGLEIYEIDRFHVYQIDENGDYGAMHVVDGLNTELDISGLQDGEYHFAVTVVDNDGLESDYSEVVTVSVL